MDEVIVLSQMWGEFIFHLVSDLWCVGEGVGAGGGGDIVSLSAGGDVCVSRAKLPLPHVCACQAHWVITPLLAGCSGATARVWCGVSHVGIAQPSERA